MLLAHPRPATILNEVTEVIPPAEFTYRLFVDGHLVSRRLIFRGPLRVGDLFPLAEGGGRVMKIVRDDDEGAYEIHVTPLV
jgi:hypothetical protein